MVCKRAIEELSRIKFCLEDNKDEFDSKIFNFLLVTFSSIIRKSSNADPRIAKTYKSKRVRKRNESGWEPNPITDFRRALIENYHKVRSLSNITNSDDVFSEIYSRDVKDLREILRPFDLEVGFMITSPPYINAQDYFRSYKLELWWLGLATPEDINYLSRQTIGTEKISKINYDKRPSSNLPLLDFILNKVWTSRDEKRVKTCKRKAYIIFNYFDRMKQLFKEFYEVLSQEGLLCIISGNNTICNVEIPTFKILAQLAEQEGFHLFELGKDKIKNRSIPPIRNHKCGIINDEWITLFRM